MDTPIVSVFLSDAGRRQARQVYDRRNHASGRPAPADYDWARDVIFEGNWDSYDDIYVALYTLRLAGGKYLPRKNIDFGRRPAPPGGVKLDVTLDIDVAPDYARQSMLDQWAVADIMEFRAALDDLIPMRSTILYVGFGCVMLSFLLSGGRERDADDADATIDGLHEYLNLSNLDAIKQRYRVSKFDLGSFPAQ